MGALVQQRREGATPLYGKFAWVEKFKILNDKREIFATFETPDSCKVAV